MIDLPADETPPLIQLLPLSSEAGAYRVPDAHAAALRDAADELGFASFAIDLAGCTDEASLFARIAQALAFPDWFGHNWDALADCLSDMEWQGEAGGYLLLFLHAEAMQAVSADLFAELIDVIDEVARAWHEIGVPFWGFIAQREG